MKGFSFEDRLRVPDDVLMQELPGDESAFVNLETERYFGLDDVGTRMWQVLTAADSIRSGYETLLAEYDVKPELLEKDIRELIDSLLEQGLVEVGPPIESGE